MSTSPFNLTSFILDSAQIFTAKYSTKIRAAICILLGIFCVSGFYLARMHRRSAKVGSTPGYSLDYGALPISFVPNQGQYAVPILYAAHGGGYSIWMTRTGTTFDLSRPTAKSKPFTNVTLEFAGTNADGVVEGLETQTGASNFFIGSRSNWRTTVPNYGRLRYAGLYKGVDLEFYGNQRALEYDLIVAPKADVNQIAFT